MKTLSADSERIVRAYREREARLRACSQWVDAAVRAGRTITLDSVDGFLSGFLACQKLACPVEDASE